MFAALNSVEPHVQNLVSIDLFNATEDWARARRPAAEKFAVARLDSVAASLDGRDYLVGSFTVARLLMTTVLRFLRHTDLFRSIRCSGLTSHAAKHGLHSSGRSHRRWRTS